MLHTTFPSSSGRSPFVPVYRTGPRAAVVRPGFAPAIAVSPTPWQRARARLGAGWTAWRDAWRARELERALRQAAASMEPGLRRDLGLDGCVGAPRMAHWAELERARW